MEFLNELQELIRLILRSYYVPLHTYPSKSSTARQIEPIALSP